MLTTRFNLVRLLLLPILALFVIPIASHADGMLLPPIEPGRTSLTPVRQIFSVKYHHVNVNINNQAASTSVDQVFHNESSRDAEGTYIFPLVDGATISRFSMFVGDREVEAKMYDKAEARRIYEGIVRQQQDPALLEYLGRNMFKASIYPIPANGDKRVKIGYSEMLNKSGAMVRYVYPLSTEKFSAKPLDDVSITIHLQSKSPITNIYSPTHEIDVKQTSPTEAVVEWKGSNVKPDRDLVLYYSLSDQDFPIQVLTHREPGESGYFMLLASPRQDPTVRPQPKQVVFVFDRTGSMSGKKIEQAKGALTYCLSHLNANDRFNVVMFNEDASWFKPNMVSATKANIQNATAMVDNLDARGGTNIDKALRSALQQFPAGLTANQGKPYVIFLTDGVPTVGITDTNAILKNMKLTNKRDISIFAFGVGDDVNAQFLDQLTQDYRADADYVRPNEDIETKVTAFFDKVSEPVLNDVTLTSTGVPVLNMHPSDPLPDIFKGSQLIVIGRYDGAGETTFTLSGSEGNKKRTYSQSVTLPASNGDNDFIPRLWAARRIGYLLDEIRLHRSTELIDEVVKLSKDFGIPTEFTSFLADERESGIALPAATARAKSAAASASSADSGSWAVAQSSNSRALRNQTQVPGAAQRESYVSNVGSSQAGGGGFNSYSGSGFGTTNTFVDSTGRTVSVNSIQNVGTRTFYRRNNQWVDAKYQTQHMYKIRQYSEAHFQLIEAQPELRKYSTLGDLTVIVNGNAVQIGPEGKDKLTRDEIKAIVGKS